MKLTREQTQARKDKAVRFVEDVLQDPDRAEEIDDEDLESYASRKHIRLVNPEGGKSIMGKVRIWNPYLQSNGQATQPSPAVPSSSSGAQRRPRQSNPRPASRQAVQTTAADTPQAVTTPSPAVRQSNPRSARQSNPKGNGNGTTPDIALLMDIQRQNLELQRQNDEYQDQLDRIADLASCDDPDEDLDADELAGKLNDILDISAAGDIEEDDEDE
jgi:hypothetical protein